MKFLSNKIKEQEKNNEQIVLDYWEQVSKNGRIETTYESLSKKIKNYSEEYSLTQSELADKLLNLDGLAKSQVLKHWVIKAERQNLNEEWKKQYIRDNSNMVAVLLSKSGDESLHLNEQFNITPKKNKKTQCGYRCWYYRLDRWHQLKLSPACFRYN
jgi:hypothetical protein